jgi:hypothetical protein
MVTRATRDVVDLSVRAITPTTGGGGIVVEGDGSPNFSISGTQIGLGAGGADDGLFINLEATNLVVTGTINGNGAVLAGTWPATYSDLAECYESDHLYNPGTVVKLGGVKEITETADDMDWDVFGVISTEPAYLLNSGRDGTYLPVALIGRVPCRVVGPVRKGQRLIATEGGMARAIDAKIAYNLPSFGRSLEDNDRQGEKLVEVAIITIK